MVSVIRPSDLSKRVSSAINSLPRPTMDTLSPQPKLVTASKYIPDSPFKPLNDVPRMSDDEKERTILHIKEQRNAIAVAIEQQGAIADLYKLEGASMQAQFVHGQNELKRAGYQMDLNFQADKLINKKTAQKELLSIDKQSWDTKIDSAKAKLTHEQNKLKIDKATYSTLEGLHQEKANARIAKVQAGIQKALKSVGDAIQIAETLEAEIVN